MFQRACTPWVKNTIQTKGTASISDVKFYKSLLNIFVLGIYTFICASLLPLTHPTPGSWQGKSFYRRDKQKKRNMLRFSVLRSPKDRTDLEATTSGFYNPG